MWDSRAMWAKFVDAVGRHFRFLETEFGFVQASTKRPFVMYESDKLQVEVFYDVLPGNRHELDLDIRRLDDDPRRTRSVGIGTLMLLADQRPLEGYMLAFPSTPDELEAEVQRLAELVETYGTSILSGDERDFERVDKLRREREREWGTKPESGVPEGPQEP